MKPKCCKYSFCFRDKINSKKKVDSLLLRFVNVLKNTVNRCDTCLTKIFFFNLALLFSEIPKINTCCLLSAKGGIFKCSYSNIIFTTFSPARVMFFHEGVNYCVPAGLSQAPRWENIWCAVVKRERNVFTRGKKL